MIIFPGPIKKALTEVKACFMWREVLAIMISGHLNVVQQHLPVALFRFTNRTVLFLIDLREHLKHPLLASFLTFKSPDQGTHHHYNHYHRFLLETFHTMLFYHFNKVLPDQRLILIYK